MKNFEIQKLHNSVYPYLILATSYVNPLSNLDDIESVLKPEDAGKVIFDLLLANGVSSNRYMEAEFDGDRFDFTSFRPLEEVDTHIKEQSGEFYRKNEDLLDNSVLPRSHRFLLKKGKNL